MSSYLAFYEILSYLLTFCIKDIWLTLIKFHVCSFQGTILTDILSVIRIHKHPYQLWSLVNPVLYLSDFHLLFSFWSGGHLLSHTVSSAVPSAACVLTVVFGMGTGVSHKRIATRSIYSVIRKFDSLNSSFLPVGFIKFLRTKFTLNSNFVYTRFH